MSGTPFESFRIPVWETLKKTFAFLWEERRNLVLMAALPVVFMAIYSSILELTLLAENGGAAGGDAGAGSGEHPLWLLALAFLPQPLLHAMFAAAWNRAYLVRSEASTVWTALRWDQRKTRFLLRSILILTATTALSVVAVTLIAIFLVIGALGIPVPEEPPDGSLANTLPGILAIAISLPLAARLNLWLPAATVDSPLSLVEIWRLGSRNTLRLTLILAVSIVIAAAISIFGHIVMVEAAAAIFPDSATVLLLTNLAGFALSYLGLAVTVTAFAATYDHFLLRLANDPFYNSGMMGP